MKTMLKRFWLEEEGGHTVEWSLIAAIVAAVIVLAWTALGPAVVNALSDVASDLATADTIASGG